MIGITLSKSAGLGDSIQFSSLPENYFRAHGQKMVDISKPWFLDHNPYVLRDVAYDETLELWNWPKSYDWPRPRESVYLSNAEIWAKRFKVEARLNRPRLYVNESYPYELRETILLQTVGRSNGRLPEGVIQHVIDKYYETHRLYQIGLERDESLGIPWVETPTLWDLAKVISRARMVIGPDSGPAWIAACYPDVIVKKVRVIWQEGYRQPKDWVPLEIDHHHSHWDDRCHQVYNTTEDDIGFTWSYRRL